MRLDSSTSARALRRTRRRFTKQATGMAVVAGIACLGTAGAIVASAAVPEFPNNIVVFPDRDFVAVEGYQDHVGEMATLEVTRPGKGVIGSAMAKVSGGDLAFEINHPGGECWGAGTGINVTPDIQAGDTVSVKLGSNAAGDTTVQDAAATSHAVRNGTTLTVSGHVGPGVNTAQMEQRIVNPDLVGTDVAKRDVRAVPGGLVTAPTGGYRSSLEFGAADAAGRSFTATYIFDTLATAEIAEVSGGERAMTWEVEDAAANRQGLSIAEFGELGGPGMGGCPAGPADQAAPQPGAASVIRSADNTSVAITWNPATAQPAAAPVSGYSVVAIAKTAAASGEQTGIVRRTSAGTRKTTISGLTPAESYTVEVRSIAGPRMSEAYTVSDVSPRTPADTTPPTLSATPEATPGMVTRTDSVTLNSNGQVFYTTDGSPAIANGDTPADNARLYTGPIQITAPIKLNVAAFDRAGNNKVLPEGDYAPPAGPTTKPGAPTDLTATEGQQSATLKWTSTDTSITNYRVLEYAGPTDTTPVSGAPVRDTPNKTLTITNLTVGKTYWFTVKAENANGFGPETSKVAVTPVGDRVAITTARWKAGDFRIVGTGSVTGANVTVHRVNADGSIGAAITGATATVTAPVAPATVGDYTIRVRGGAPATNPGRIVVKSDKGGVTAPFTVVNG